MFVPESGFDFLFVAGCEEDVRNSEMNISELGAKEDMIDGITEGTLILEGGYKVLTKDEIRRIFKDSLYKRRTNE